jgi:TOTE conflict system primase-like protein
MSDNTSPALSPSTNPSFIDLFQGSNLSHGVLKTKTDGSFDHTTVNGPASSENYESHFAGKVGLGLVPVRIDGTCRFGAIDIDEDTINHQMLYNKVQEYKMPLSVCRSKSGGAHLYLFAKEPGIKASKMIPVLRRWAALLGYFKAEIFPKQNVISAKNLGNWINLPYFNGDSTLRYAMGADGSLLLDEFLASITYWDGEDKVEAPNPLHVLNSNSGRPPCLDHFMEHPLTKGERNNGLFNFGVYYRKSQPDDWEELLAKHNKNLSQPLTKGELGNLTRSLRNKKYFYTCDDEPIVSHCDRKTCLSREFGVGNKEAETCDPFEITKIQKTKDVDPRYIVQVNGTGELTVSSKELLHFEALREIVFRELDLVIAPMSKNQWLSQLYELKKTMEVVDGDHETSEDQSVIDAAEDFLARANEAFGTEDLLKGCPVLDAKTNEVLFRRDDLLWFLTRYKRMYTLKGSELAKVLRRNGFKDTRIEVCGKKVRVWSISRSLLNVQTKDFTSATFKKSEFDETIAKLAYSSTEFVLSGDTN